MKPYRILILIGLALYVASFFLTAVGNAGVPTGGGGVPGYTCATLTLLAPWGSDGLKLLHDSPIDFFAALISGWINPVFLIAVLALLLRPTGRLAGMLRIVLVLMFPACWIIFHRAHLQPRAGYYLWTAAMLVAVSSSKLAKTSSSAPVESPV